MNSRKLTISVFGGMWGSSRRAEKMRSESSAVSSNSHWGGTPENSESWVTVRRSSTLSQGRRGGKGDYANRKKEKG